MMNGDKQAILAVFVMFVSEGVKKRGVLLFSRHLTKFSSKIECARDLEMVEKYAIMDDGSSPPITDDQL